MKSVSICNLGPAVPASRRAWLRTPVLALSSLALVLIFSLTVACTESQPDVEQLGAGQTVTRETIPVETLALRPRDYVDTFEITGLVKADEDVQVASEASGRVIHVAFDQGDWVEKGALLVRLDDDAVQAQIRRLLATIERELTQLETARKDLQREESLFREGVGAEKAYDDAASRVRTLEVQVTEARAALEETRVLERKSEIFAPLPGRIAERHVSVGEYVNPGSPIAHLVKIDRVKFEFSLAERDVPRVSLGQELEFTVDAYPGLLLRAPIATISPAGNAITRTFAVTLMLENLEERPLLPGMSGKVRVVRQTFEDVYLIPEDAVLRGEEGAYVYLIRERLAEPASVEVVSSSGPLAVVRAPVIEEGAEGVILGQYALSPGSAVNVRRKYEEPPIVEFD